jgi:hypothetical protein
MRWEVRGDDIEILLPTSFPDKLIDKCLIRSNSTSEFCISKVKYMEVFTKKIIPIFLTLITLLSILPSSAFAEDQNVPPLPGSEESFDQMKSQMTESVNRTIETLENSTGNLDNESSLESAEKLITDLKSIKEEISNAKTEDELFTIKKELDALFAAAPEELKSILPQDMGPMGGSQNMGQGPGQNGNENLSQGFENGSERRPEMLSNRSQQPMDANATMNDSKMPGQGPRGMEEKGNLTEENGKEKADDSGFFGKLINALKSIFS